VEMDVRTLGERLVKITLTGRLDTPTVNRVETRFLESIVPGGNNAIVDVSQIDFVASMGIRMLVSAARALHGRQATLAVYGAQERVGQIFDVVALGQIMSICATEAEALAAVGSSLDGPGA
jgi:anti-sigma B factor antagonist